MCKEKKTENPENKDDGDKTMSVRTFTLISILFIITMSFLIIWPLINRTAEVHTINLVLHIPQDSIAMKNVYEHNCTQLGAIVDDFNQLSKSIDSKYELLIKSQETESDFFRLVSCIAGFIVALLGFLGYRTIKDIEDKAASIAAKKSDETSRTYVKQHLKQTVEAQVKELVKDSMVSALIREQIMNKMNNEVLKPLENRISTLENKGTSTSENISSEQAEPQNSLFGTPDLIIDEICKDGGLKDE